MNIEEIISSGLLELYALGMSSPEETQQVENWIARSPEVKQELDQIEMSMEIYASEFTREPSASVKDKVFASIQNRETSVSYDTARITDINSTSSSAKVVRIPSSFKALAAAMVVLLIGSIILNYVFFTKYQSANNELVVANNNLQAAQNSSQTAQANLKSAQQKLQENAEMKNEMEVIGDKHSLPVVLNGTPYAPDALAKIYWLKNSGQVYIDPTNLPDVPAGKQYQLWAIVDGKPVSAGLITTDKGTYRIQKMKSFGHAQAFAITLEKAGGSPTPTMDQMYVMSKI